jgi:hypothetical protein
MTQLCGKRRGNLMLMLVVGMRPEVKFEVGSAMLLEIRKRLGR